jgi:HAMP domain-containing protein
VQRFRSIATLLAGITGILVVALVSSFTLLARDAYQRKNGAARTLAAVQIERDILSAKVALRAESSLIEAGGDWAGLADLHAKSKTQLSLVAAELNKYTGGNKDRGVSRLVAALAQYDDTVHELTKHRNFGSAKPPKNIFSRWRLIYTNLLNETNDRAESLSLDIVRSDSANNDLIDVNRAAWNVRVMAGTDRRLVTTLIGSGSFITTDQFMQLAESSDKIDALWAKVQDRMKHFSPVPALNIAVEKVQHSYFQDVRLLRKDIIDRLANGKGAPISQREWIERSDEGLNSISAVSDVALNLTESRESSEFSAATRHFYFSIVLMLLSIALAAFAALYVIFRVIWPLKRITQSMRTVIDGNLAHAIPFSDRPDEIGQFARTLQRFRDGAVEKQQLQQELLRK